MKIVAAADHGGFEMKNQIVEDLRKQGFAVEDLGTNSADSVDYVAKVAREHNNANVLCFGGRTMTTEDVLRRIGIFLKAAYEGGRHDRRLCKLDLD